MLINSPLPKISVHFRIKSFLKNVQIEKGRQFSDEFLSCILGHESLNHLLH